MSEQDYPLRLRLLIASVVVLALPVVAGAGAAIALTPPSWGTAAGVVLFLALAVLADLKPVPLDIEQRSSASLAFVFILASQILFGWEYAALTATISVMVSQLAERRPLVRCLFNAAVYALAAFVSALPVFALGLGSGSDTVALTAIALVGGAAFVAVNVTLVATAVALHQRISLRGLLGEDFKHAGPAFVVMAFLAALAVALWRTDPFLLVLLAGPLFALTLYQRSALASKIARRDAHTDSLTGLGNHRAYELDLGAAFEEAAESGEPVSLCLLDVDDFKGVNDTFGHPLGDQALVDLASVMETDERVQAYRLGGDEFALILRAGEAAAYRFVEDLHRRVSDIRFGHGQPVTISVGLGTFPDHAGDPDALERVADGALYWAKGHGKNRSCVYAPSLVRIYTPAELELRAERSVRLRAARNLVRVVDAKDAYTGAHSESVSLLVERIGCQLGLEDDVVEQLKLAGLLHDLGKIAISDRVLQKPGPLTVQEMQLVRTHPELGYSLLDGLELDPVDLWIRHHHEHWDGSGYPHGLVAEDIPLGSRVILVADAYDAMTSERSYRRAASPDDAVAELRRMSGRQFDPGVVAALERFVAAEQDEIAGLLAEASV
ncbi:MAG TPA: diguanylate cyclase [Gaiellaceae bacterium]|nr:diguanylate cyclase [Gaiellaceae bacterium]